MVLTMSSKKMMLSQECETGVSSLILSTRTVDDLVIITHQPCQVSVLLRGLNHLCEELLKAHMISNDDEAVAK